MLTDPPAPAGGFQALRKPKVEFGTTAPSHVADRTAGRLVNFRLRKA
jgi:hypothetical protein